MMLTIDEKNRLKSDFDVRVYVYLYRDTQYSGRGIRTRPSSANLLAGEENI